MIHQDFIKISRGSKTHLERPSYYHYLLHKLLNYEKTFSSKSERLSPDDTGSEAHKYSERLQFLVLSLYKKIKVLLPSRRSKQKRNTENA